MGETADGALLEFQSISSLADVITWAVESASDSHHFFMSWAILGQYLLHGAYGMIALVLLSFSFGWLFWLLLSFCFTVVQLVYAFYLLLGISLNLTTISVLKFITKILSLVSGVFKFKEHKRKKVLSSCKNYDSYQNLTEIDDDKLISSEWKLDNSDYANASVLMKTTSRLSLARAEKRFADLQFLLSGVLKRDHLGIHSEELHNKSTKGTKACIESFQEEVERCLSALVEAGDSEMTMKQKLAFFKKERRSLGQSALCLSGGGSICMYHIGIIKALIDGDVYKHIRVLSGTSGGSIIAAMVACKTESEFRDYVIQNSVSTDFRHDGSQQAQGIRWFPPLMQQLLYFMRNGVLVDKHEFKRTCDYYYGDITFAEAYARTKRHVSISVTGRGTGSRLLLNHISSPHVTLASSVAASCALPGIMLAQPLEAKDANGKVVTFDVDGTDYVDGSIAADLPFKRMSTLFNVSAFYVSQVNFHVSPFMRRAESPEKSSYYWSLIKFCEDDLRHRARKLAKLGVLPTFFGVSMSSVFKQKYHGDVTMVPSFTPMESIGLKAVLNPTPKDIEGYISGGERAAWPHINRIRFMMRTEVCLRRCVGKLRTMLIERPKGTREKIHRYQMQSLKSETSLATLNGSVGVSREGGQKIPLPPICSPDRPYTDADEFGLLSDNDDEEEEEEDKETSDLEEYAEESDDSKFRHSLMSSFDEDETLLADLSTRSSPARSKRKQAQSSGAQLMYEMKVLQDQITSLRSENIELRTRLSDISALAELAVSTSTSTPVTSPTIETKRKSASSY